MKDSEKITNSKKFQKLQQEKLEKSKTIPSKDLIVRRSRRTSVEKIFIQEYKEQN